VAARPSPSIARRWRVHGGTYRKEHFFCSRQRLDLLQSQLLSLAKHYRWRLQTWAVFSNHYHFVATSPEDASSLPVLLHHLHSTTAAFVNRDEHASGRRIWFNYWDTHLTYEASYLARLRYVHENAVHHGLVRHAVEYPWCSARWLEDNGDPVFVRKVATFKIDRLGVRDEYDALPVD